MSFLSPELVELKEATRRFTEEEIAPIAQALHLKEEQIPQHVVDKMGEMGFFGVWASPEYGGLGLGAKGVAIVTEELARGWFSVGSLPARNWGACTLLEKYGTAEQKARILPDVISGKKQTASAGTEPEAGSDAANIKTRATLKDRAYRVTGSKLWCTNADRADYLFTYVRTSDESKHGGISLLMLEKTAGEFSPPKLTGHRLRTIGYHGMHSYQLFFDEYEVPAENLLGGVEGKAFKQLMAMYEMIRVQFAFRCIGLAQAAFEAALDYSGARVQFGEPICKFPAIREKLANMATQISAARAFGYSVAEKIDRGERSDVEAGMCKLFAADMAQYVCREAVQVHGGNGFAVEYPVNRYWRDSGLLTIGEGTSEIQREVIARGLVGR